MNTSNIQCLICLITEDQLRLLFSKPKSVRGTDEENTKDFYMDSDQRPSKMIEASNAGKQF